MSASSSPMRGQKLAYVYFDEPPRRAVNKRLTRG